MELHARLIHAEAGLRVVEVRASRGEQSLGSTLAEAATAQEAEDLAIARLLRRLQGTGHLDSGTAASTRLPIRRSGAAESGGRPPGRPAPVLSPDHATPTAGPAQSGRLQHVSNSAQDTSEQDQAPAAVASGATDSASFNRPGAAPGPTLSSAAQPHKPSEAQPQLSAREGQTTGLDVPPLLDESPAGLANDPQEEPPADPEDWSQELTAIDLQLRRLGWNREQEGTYLSRAFGHASRSRLTRYSDLRAYLMALEALERGSDPAVASVPLRRSELLAQGDALLTQLGWSAEQGRAFLERELHRISRQQLSDVQLLQFNMLLEGELLAPAARDGAQR